MLLSNDTQNIIELNYDIRGIPVIFYDTAGLRKSSKRIESIGIVKSIEKSKLSDINIIMVENTREIRKYKQISRFLIARILYNDEDIKIIKNFLASRGECNE